jgi:hypothetical protein
LRHGVTSAFEAGARRGVEDGVGVEPIGAEEIRQVAGLTEAVDAERVDAVLGDAAEPGQGGRMRIYDGDEGRIARLLAMWLSRPTPRRLASQSACSRSGDVTTRRPAPGKSSTSASCACKASGVTAPQQTIASSAPSRGSTSQ